MFSHTYMCLVLGSVVGMWPMLRIELRPHHQHDDKTTNSAPLRSSVYLHPHHHHDEQNHHQDHDDSRNPVLSVDLHVPAAGLQAFGRLLDVGAIAMPEIVLLIDRAKPFRFELLLGESPHP